MPAAPGVWRGGSVKLPSVTQILAPHSDFSQVPAHLLGPAQDRGDAVHELCALYANRLWIQEVPVKIDGYFQSFKAWFDQAVEEVILVEAELRDEDRAFCGHPDLIARLRGDTGLSLIDYKTAKPLSKGWRLQLAGYKLLAEKNGYPITRVASLRPQQDGRVAKFQEYSRTLAYDFNIFLAELAVWRFFHV
jgi:predicted RecB family nuclease